MAPDHMVRGMARPPVQPRAPSAYGDDTPSARSGSTDLTAPAPSSVFGHRVRAARAAPQPQAHELPVLLQSAPRASLSGARGRERHRRLCRYSVRTAGVAHPQPPVPPLPAAGPPQPRARRPGSSWVPGPTPITAERRVRGVIPEVVRRPLGNHHHGPDTLLVTSHTRQTEVDAMKRSGLESTLTRHVNGEGRP
jgi:hypothetical protein